MRLIAIAALCLAGCAGSPSPPTDPLAVISDPKAHVNERTRALEAAQVAAEAGSIGADALRAELKNVLWDPSAPASLRVDAYQTLVSDEANLADSRRFSALRLPTETSADVVAEICHAVVEHGWTDATSALVRSYSRPAKEVDDDARPERAALEALHPETPLVRVAFDVFVDPQVVEGDSADDRRRRARTDAWTLLARLDPDGAVRAGYLREAEPAPAVDVVRWSVTELHTLPIAGQELRWLDRLAETRADPNGWWRTTERALASLSEDQLVGVRIRHLESIRWAAEHRPDLLLESRDALLERLREMDASRRHHRRSGLGSTLGPTRDRLREWEDELTWGDMVSILVIDEAMQNPMIVDLLFAQAGMDHADDTTEYGGTLEASESGFAAQLYRPRPNARLGDNQFIASQDMIDNSSFSIAHYHFHAQRIRNGRYAGPSQGDRVYATQQGRTCLIITSIETGVLGVDVLMPNDVTIDIGEIRR